MVAVPLYDTLGPEALVFIINQGNWSFTSLANAANCRNNKTSSNSVPIGVCQVTFNLIYFFSMSLCKFADGKFDYKGKLSIFCLGVLKKSGSYNPFLKRYACIFLFPISWDLYSAL